MTVYKAILVFWAINTWCSDRTFNFSVSSAPAYGTFLCHKQILNTANVQRFTRTIRDSNS